MFKKYYYGTGRRKTSSARVFLEKGIGNIIINKFNLIEYFKKNIIYKYIFKPLKEVKMVNKINLYITVRGGGTTGQIEAINHGISRALIKLNYNFKKILKKKKFLTRDSRKVERKKFGLRKSRCKPQFSKR